MCSRRRSFQLQKGVAFWFQEDDECAEWLCERCCDFDPKDPHVKSDKEGYTRWACEKRGEPSQEPETHMQTWPAFCEWGIVVEDEKKNPLLTKNNNSTLIPHVHSKSPHVVINSLSYIDDTRASGAGRRQGGASPNAPRPISASPDRNRVISRQNNNLRARPKVDDP